MFLSKQGFVSTGLSTIIAVSRSSPKALRKGICSLLLNSLIMSLMNYCHSPVTKTGLSTNFCFFLFVFFFSNSWLHELKPSSLCNLGTASFELLNFASTSTKASDLQSRKWEKQSTGPRTTGAYQESHMLAAFSNFKFFNIKWDHFHWKKLFFRSRSYFALRMICCKVLWSACNFMQNNY